MKACEPFVELAVFVLLDESLLRCLASFS